MTIRAATAEVDNLRLRPRRFHLRPVYRDIALTALTALLVAASGVLVVSLVARHRGPQSVAEYLLLRRVGTWVYTGALLGMGVAVPRYVAFAVDNPDLRERYFWASVLPTGGIAILLGILLNIVPGFSARWLFGSKDSTSLVIPLSLLVVSQIAHALVFAYCRGRLWMRRANALQVVNMAVVPFLTVALLWRTHSISSIVSWGAAATVLVTLVGASSLHLHGAYAVSRLTFDAGKDLLHYGIVRLPCDFGTAALFALGPLIASHYVPMREVGFLLLGLGLLTVIGTSTNPMNQVLLSKVSMMLARGQWEHARLRVEHLFEAALEGALFVSLQALVFADVIIRAWVGPQYLGRMLLIRLCLLAIPFYLFYTALRSVIDAAAVEAHNARNVLAALLTFAALISVGVHITARQFLLEAISASLLAALVLLSILTAHTVARLYHCRVAWGQIALSCSWAVLLGGVSFFLRRALAPDASLPVIIAIGFFVVLTFAAGLWKLQSPWLITLVGDVLPMRTAAESCIAAERRRGA